MEQVGEFRSEMAFRLSCWRCSKGSQHRNLEVWGEVETGEVYLKFSGREMVSKVRGLMKLPGKNTELAHLSGATTPGTSLSLQPYPHLHLEVLPAGNHTGNLESTGSLRRGTCLECVLGCEIPSQALKAPRFHTSSSFPPVLAPPRVSVGTHPVKLFYGAHTAIHIQTICSWGMCCLISSSQQDDT